MNKLPPDVAIRVENVYKDFHLPHNNEDSIKHKIITAFEKRDKDVDTLHALRGISFDIKKGEFFGILGRNGSGKSTLLKIISDIYRPTKGTVRHRGSLVAFIELGVGFNPQLTGRENVYLNAALLGFSRTQIDEFYDEVVAFAELQDHMEQKLKNYSSGMKVRLAFAVAVQAHADILVLDEVLAVGDADFQRKCYNYFKELKDNNKTIIFVSHSMGQVREYCDKAILIDDGRVTHSGDAESVADEYLKLFNKSSDKNQTQDSKRWGDGSVRVNSINLTVKSKTLALDVELQAADKSMNNVKFGFQIKGSDGRVVAGANNLNVDGGKKLDFMPGESKKLHYSMPNIFGNQTYSLSATVNALNGTIICDKWLEITSFANNKDQAFYPVVCPAKLTIS